MMRVLFRVNASPDIGLGHLMRCLALAQHMVERCIDVTFAVSSTSVPFCKSRADWVGEIYTIPDEKSGDCESLVHHINQNQCDWVVLDGYEFTSAFRKELSGSCARLALFDDENNSGKLYADLVICSASKQALDGYRKTAPSAILCVGEEYRVLRSEFSQLSPKPWDKRQFLTIIFGGSDPFNFTIPLLRALNKMTKTGNLAALPPVKVLTGAAYSKLYELNDMLNELEFDVEQLHDIQEVSSVFNESRLVVSAAGGTQFELLACHTPSVLLVVAENQRPTTSAAQKQGWCRVVDSDTDAIQRISFLIESLLNTPKILKTMHREAANYSDTKGAERVVEQMESVL